MFPILQKHRHHIIKIKYTLKLAIAFAVTFRSLIGFYNACNALWAEVRKGKTCAWAEDT